MSKELDDRVEQVKALIKECEQLAAKEGQRFSLEFDSSSNDWTETIRYHPPEVNSENGETEYPGGWYNSSWSC